MTTACFFAAPIYLVFSSNNKIFCEKKSTRTIFLLIGYFVLMWPVQFYIFLFYKRMAKNNEAQERANDEEYVCTCDQVAQETEDLLEDKNIVNII